MRNIFLFTLLIIATLASAATPIRGIGHGDYHFGYVSASAGYSSLSNNVSEASVKGDWATLVGAGYEFRMNNGWVSVGFQFMQEQSTVTPDPYVYDSPVGGWDDENDPVDFYRYTIQQTDRQIFRTVDIPLLAGYYNSGFYVGAGFKVGFSVASTITTSGSFDLGAKYKDGIGVIENVGPYTTYACSDKQYNAALRPQISLLGEIGYDLLSSMTTNSTICHMLKIGVYAEYGLRSVHPNAVIDPIQLNDMNFVDAAKVETDVTQAHMTPYFISSQTSNRRIAPFYVGVKLTYLIGGSWSTTRTWHKGCQCYQ